jgi:hypothetical protein
MLLNRPFDEEISSLEIVKGTDVLGVAKHRSTIIIWIEVICMALFVIGAWFSWGWIMPLIWSTGPTAILDPSLWTFSGTAILVRVLWNIIFLCPKTK